MDAVRPPWLRLLQMTDVAGGDDLSTDAPVPVLYFVDFHQRVRHKIGIAYCKKFRSTGTDNFIDAAKRAKMD
jgi:hypothetical protein